MTWNHRLVKKTYKSPNSDYSEEVYAIHECYYNEDKSVWAVTENPVSLLTADENLSDEEAIKNLRQTLEWMTKALEAPIIDLDTFVFTDRVSRKGSRKSKTPNNSV